MNPYLLPDGNVLIAFSGGRTSAYMLYHIIEDNGGLPDRVVVSFQNTGREDNRTLYFVHELGERWSVPIVWLEYAGGPPVGFNVVNYATASRNGEPFADLIRRKRALPNQQHRFCTQELKIRTAKRYLVSRGWKAWTTARGIRADETHRQKPLIPYERSTPWHPLVDAGVTKQDVAMFWRAQPFRLNLPVVNGNTINGNCTDCFLKSEETIAAHIRDRPEDDWCDRMEASTGHQFSKRYSRRELREHVARMGPGLFSTEGALCQANDGECM